MDESGKKGLIKAGRARAEREGGAKAKTVGSRQNVGTGSYSASRISMIPSITDVTVWSLRWPAR